MKTTFKLFLVLTGMTSAAIVASSDLKAGGNSATMASGYCKNTTATCGKTANGTILYGTWTEVVDPGN